MRTIYIDKENLNERKSKKVAKKLYKISRKEDIVIALSSKLRENEELNELICNYGLKVLDGRWLFKFLLYDILEYISIKKNERLENQNVAILMNNLDEIIMQELPEIAKEIKTLKIVSSRISKFSYMEEKLYTEFGIALQVTNNKKKSLINTNIIINFDFSEELIDEYLINPYATVVNINEKIKLDSNKFKGTNINNYQIEFNENNFDEFLELEKSDFDENILYESYIYRKDNFFNIYKQLKKDEVKLVELA